MDLNGIIHAMPAINGGLLVGLLALITRTFIANRKLTIGENAGLRQEFIAEMHALREEVKDLRSENDTLRKEVRELHGVIDGMRRENLAQGISIQQAVLDKMPAGLIPPATAAALDRIKATGE